MILCSKQNVMHFLIDRWQLYNNNYQCYQTTYVQPWFMAFDVVVPILNFDVLRLVKYTSFYT